MFKMKVSLVLMGLLFLFACSDKKADNEGAKVKIDDPIVAKWILTAIEVEGVSQPGQDGSMLFKDDGTLQVTVGINSAEGSWKKDGDKLVTKVGNFPETQSVVEKLAGDELIILSDMPSQDQSSVIKTRYSYKKAQ